MGPSGDTCVYPSSDNSYKPFYLDYGWVLFPNTTQTLEEYHAAVVANITSQQDNGGTYTPATCTPASSNEIAIGAGLGASLGVALLIALALLAWQWRRANKLAKELVQTSIETRSKEQAPQDMRSTAELSPGADRKPYLERHDVPQYETQIHEAPDAVQPGELEAQPGKPR